MGDNPQSLDYAILYVGSMGLIGLISYLFIVGPLDRITLTLLSRNLTLWR
ncbi:TPA: glucarate transporter [Citrobacter freundii]|nr:glucarate transporter [Citrobacter freundii]HBN5501260.1 glucarate transporter [Citrobacter freundii]HBU9123504.1 glucarate transporter [Citrobacter freundii]